MSFVLHIIPPPKVPLNWMSAVIGEIDQIVSGVLENKPITPALGAHALQTLQGRFPTYQFSFEPKPNQPNQPRL